MQKRFASHAPLAEAHVSLVLDNVQVEVFDIRKHTFHFLDFAVTHDVGTAFGGLLTNVPYSPLERSAAQGRGNLAKMLDDYVVTQ